jgi:hypothetical protein
MGVLCIDSSHAPGAAVGVLDKGDLDIPIAKNYINGCDTSIPLTRNVLDHSTGFLGQKVDFTRNVKVLYGFQRYF